MTSNYFLRFTLRTFIVRRCVTTCQDLKAAAQPAKGWGSSYSRPSSATLLAASTNLNFAADLALYKKNSAKLHPILWPRIHESAQAPFCYVTANESITEVCRDHVKIAEWVTLTRGMHWISISWENFLKKCTTMSWLWNMHYRCCTKTSRIVQKI